MRRNIIVPVTAGALLALAGAAHAATKTTGFNVSAAVSKNCFVAASDMNFGPYDGTADMTATSDINVRCSMDTPFVIKLDEGSGTGTYAARKLTDGTSELEYNLYTAVDYVSVWGDGTAGSTTVGDTGQGMGASKAITKTVYGRLPNSAANQDAPASNYFDAITVTVEY